MCEHANSSMSHTTCCANFRLATISCMGPQYILQLVSSPRNTVTFFASPFASVFDGICPKTPASGPPDESLFPTAREHFSDAANSVVKDLRWFHGAYWLTPRLPDSQSSHC